jgi:hypothetical protein
MTIKPSIIDYIGKFENGIFVKVGLSMDEDFYDAIFYYTESEMVLTVDQKLTEKIGFIENHPEYLHILKYLISKAEPFEKIIDQLDPVKNLYDQS